MAAINVIAAQRVTAQSSTTCSVNCKYNIEERLSRNERTDSFASSGSAREAMMTRTPVGNRIPGKRGGS